MRLSSPFSRRFERSSTSLDKKKPTGLIRRGPAGPDEGIFHPPALAVFLWRVSSSGSRKPHKVLGLAVQRPKSIRPIPTRSYGSLTLRPAPVDTPAP